MNLLAICAGASRALLDAAAFLVILSSAVLAAAFAFPPRAVASAASASLIRYPDISSTAIVFTYADDLWVVPRAGGDARRLSSSGGEKRAKFSPDGQTLAYSALRDSRSEPYTVPVGGGVPTRLLHHPAGARVLGWEAQGRSVLIASAMESEHPGYNQLYLAPAKGGLPSKLPVPFGETAALATDGHRLVYTINKDFQEESWKRYRGGRAPKLWFYDLQTGESRRLTDGDAPDSEPIWVGEQIYFLSERGTEQRSNLWAIEAKGGLPRQVTFFKDVDVRTPSGGKQGIVFTAGSRLYLFDPAHDAAAAIDVSIADEQLALTPTWRNVADQIIGTDLSTDGASLALESHGEVFTIDHESGRTINRSQSPSSAERYPSLSPDGRTLAYFSDASGEYQLVLQDLHSGKSRTVTQFASGQRYKPQWSPDGRWIVFIDHAGDLHLIDLTTNRAEVIMRTLQIRQMEPHEDMIRFRVSWSRDSRWFAFASALPNRNHAIFLYDVKARRLSQFTSGFFNDFSPVFDPRGDYLYTLSHRRFDAINGDVDDVWAYANSTVIAAIPLRKGVPSPLDTASWKSRRAGEPAKTPIEIDLEQAESRLVVLPPDDGNIDDLAANAAELVYLSRARAGTAETGAAQVKIYRIAEKKQDTPGVRADSLQLSAKGNVALLRRDRELFRLPLKGAKIEAETVPLDSLRMLLEPEHEYPQMLREAWRYYRDFFYDPGMHGRDWETVWTRFSFLLPGVRTDNDLGFLLRELSGELGAGHVVGSPTPRRAGGNVAQVGLLGADFELSGGAYRFRRILDAGLRSPEARSPLREPGVDVREGDYLIEVNGQPVATDKDPWMPFVGLAGKVVELGVASSRNPQSIRRVMVRCLESEQKLRELAWVEVNRQQVAKLSGGKIGYLYLPDTTNNGRNDLMRQFKAQHHLPALLVDERFNRGGALGDRLVELLNRPALAYFRVRNGADYPLPTVGNGGPKALLTNGWSYSGGDGFPLLFHNAHLGPLIGSRTWGGLVGPGLYLPLINGGVVSAPPQRVYNPDGTWSGGNQGVVPDIYVETDPGALMKGRDPHIERGVGQLLEALRSQAPRKPVPPAVERTGL